MPLLDQTEEDILIEVHVETTVTLTVAEVWPDGPPATIDAFAVKEAMELAGRKEHVLKEWNLLEDLEVDILVAKPNPEWTGDKALPGFEAPARFFNSIADVWAP